MNNQLFFYPPYPYEDEMETMYEMRTNPALFTPYETMEYGNLFRKEYDGYQNYQPMKLRADNDKQKHLYEWMAWRDYCHDLKLYLDIYPNDKDMMELYRKAVRQYDEKKKAADTTMLPCPGTEDSAMKKSADVTVTAQWML